MYIHIYKVNPIPPSKEIFYMDCFSFSLLSDYQYSSSFSLKKMLAIIDIYHLINLTQKVTFLPL